MFNWIKNLFAGLDRTEAASARAGQAMEDVATLLEQARDALRQRLQGAPKRLLPSRTRPRRSRPGTAARKSPARNNHTHEKGPGQVTEPVTCPGPFSFPISQRKEDPHDRRLRNPPGQR
jgi:hypothetical protein